MTEDNDDLVVPTQSTIEAPAAESNPVETIADGFGLPDPTVLPDQPLSVSPEPVLQRRPSRLYDGTERIRIPAEIKSRYVSDPEGFIPAVSASAVTPALSTGRTSGPTPGVAAPQEATPPTSRLPRSSSVSQTSQHRADVRKESSPDMSKLRRVRSEILDASEKRKVRRPTILSPPKTAPMRGRSTSAATSTTRAGEISQTRALAHEVIAEELSEAVARRQQEDSRMLTKARHAKRSWRSWFFKAPDDAD